MTTGNIITPEQEQTYLVIGANGFVGSHLVDGLAKLPNAKVLCFDRFSRPPIFNQKANTVIIKGDFFNSQTLDSALENIDYVIHCLSISTPASSLANPDLDARMVKTNAEIFESCSKSNIKKIVFVSSADVYGLVSEKKIASENDKPEPTNPYAKAKLASEQTLEELRVKNGQAYVALRLTNPYGPRQIFKNGQGVIPTFIDNIKAGRKISVFGDGSASRDFIYIEDAAKMIMDTLTQPCNYSIYNVGSGQQTTINQLIQSLKKHLNQEINMEYIKAPTGRSRHIRVSIDRLNAELGTPKLTNLDDGMAKTLKAAGLVISALGDNRL